MSTQSPLEDLNAKIHHFIDQIGDRIIKNMEVYQYKSLINYKDDLLKTQQNFIKVRHERDEKSIKADIINNKQKMHA